MFVKKNVFLLVPYALESFESHLVVNIFSKFDHAPCGRVALPPR